MTEALLFKLIGSLYLVVGISILLNQSLYKKTFKDMIDSPLMFYFGWTLSFAIGFIMIAFYNTWSADLSVILTLFGWAALIKWILLLLFPENYMTFAKKIFAIKNILQTIGIIVVVLGILLSVIGSFSL